MADTTHPAHPHAGMTAHGTHEGTRRDFLYLATAATAGIGGLIAVWPFIDTLNPAADVLALATVEIDLSPIEPGQRITVPWRGSPVFVDHRTPAQIEAARNVDLAELPDPQPDEARVKNPEWLIMVGVCTHLGCIPLGQKPGDALGEYGGWFCPCHGSVYDTSGRIRSGPAPRNLDIPPYEFIEDNKVRIG
jgi:ubiquinol-cytochrome c reductase iron-sulfur subunit